MKLSRGSNWESDGTKCRQCDDFSRPFGIPTTTNVRCYRIIICRAPLFPSNEKCLASGLTSISGTLLESLLDTELPVY